MRVIRIRKFNSTDTLISVESRSILARTIQRQILNGECRVSEACQWPRIRKSLTTNRCNSEASAILLLAGDNDGGEDLAKEGTGGSERKHDV